MEFGSRRHPLHPELAEEVEEEEGAARFRGRAMFSKGFKVISGGFKQQQTSFSW